MGSTGGTVITEHREGTHDVARLCQGPLPPSAYKQFNLPPDHCCWWGTLKCVQCYFTTPEGCTGDCSACALDCQCRNGGIDAAKVQR